MSNDDVLKCFRRSRFGEPYIEVAELESPDPGGGWLNKPPIPHKVREHPQSIPRIEPITKIYFQCGEGCELPT